MFEDPLVFLFIGLVVVGVGGLMVTSRRDRKVEQPEEALSPMSDWKPTGKIDFICSRELAGDDELDAFVLRVEEYRRLQSISGARRLEIRWRNADLRDAKCVVSRHNASDAFFAVDHELPLPIEGPSIVPDDGHARERPLLELAKEEPDPNDTRNSAAAPHWSP